MSNGRFCITPLDTGTNDTNVTDEKVSDAILDLKDKEIALLEQQVEFFKTELKRLQVELALVSAKNKGLLIPKVT